MHEWQSILLRGQQSPISAIILLFPSRKSCCVNLGNKGEGAIRNMTLVCEVASNYLNKGIGPAHREKKGETCHQLIIWCVLYCNVKKGDNILHTILSSCMALITGHGQRVKLLLALASKGTSVWIIFNRQV